MNERHQENMSNASIVTRCFTGALPSSAGPGNADAAQMDPPEKTFRVISADHSGKSPDLRLASSRCIAARRVTLGYEKKVVLSGIDLQVSKGEFISIIGPSGVGKTTLLMAINGNVKIFNGNLTVLNHNMETARSYALKMVRSKIGFIYQGFHLVRRLSVLDNIASGMLRDMGPFCTAVKYYTHEQYEKIYEYMKAVGIEKEALQRCDRLSGGQMQRVAIARALAQQPEIMLADEPISSLDPVSAGNVMDTLAHINRQYGITVIANLHQLEYARQYCSRIVGVNAGKIVYDGASDGLHQAVVEQIYSHSGQVPSRSRRAPELSDDAPASVSSI